MLKVRVVVVREKSVHDTHLENILFMPQQHIVIIFKPYCMGDVI